MTLKVYILRFYFKSVIGSLFLILSLFILFNFLHNGSNYFARYNPSWLLIIQFYLYSLPAHIVQIMPLSALFASVITMIILHKHNEIIAMRSFGISHLDLAIPLLLGGMTLSIITFICSEYVVPISSKKLQYISQVLIEGKPSTIATNNSYWLRQHNELVNFSHLDIKQLTIKDLRIIAVDSTFRPYKITSANHAHYDKTNKLWILDHAIVTTFDQEGKVTNSSLVTNMPRTLYIDVKKLLIDKREADHMSLKELNEHISYGKSKGKDIVSYQVAWHIRWAYSLVAILMSLFGLPFAFRFERSFATIATIIATSVTGASFWFIFTTSRALAIQGDVPALVGAWSANIFLLLVTSYQVWKSAKI